MCIGVVQSRQVKEVDVRKLKEKERAKGGSNVKEIEEQNPGKANFLLVEIMVGNHNLISSLELASLHHQRYIQAMTTAINHMSRRGNGCPSGMFVVWPCFFVLKEIFKLMFFKPL